MNAFKQSAKYLIASLAGRERLLLRGPCSVGRKPRFALTFDDGPHPHHTPRLLDRLDELGLKATFFVIGQQAEQAPDLIHRMADEGHEIANHTLTHSEPSETSTAVFLEEVRRTDEILAGLTGLVPTVVRPPKGELTWGKLRGLWRIQKTVALWNVDPKDFQMTSGRQISRWCESYIPYDGDVILMHDNHPYADRALELLAERGLFDRFETATLSDWLGRSRRLESVDTRA